MTDLPRATDPESVAYCRMVDEAAARVQRIANPPSPPLSFFVAMTCKPKGNAKKIARFGKHFALRNDDKVVAAQESLTARLLEHRPPAPFAGPVRLSVAFVVDVPEGWAAWKRAAALEGRLWPTSRPDRGNLLKMIEDAMEGTFYLNDSQVVAGPVDKVYGPVAGYRVTIEELPQATKPERVPKPPKQPRVKKAKKTDSAHEEGGW